MFDVDHLKNFSQCFGVNPILTYANNVPKNGTILNAPHSQQQHPSANQCHNPHVNQNVRHGSTTSTPILPFANVPNTTSSTNLNDVNLKAKNIDKQPIVPVTSNQQTQDSAQQHNLMTTMITPVNQMLFESTAGSITGIGNNDSCFTR